MINIGIIVVSYHNEAMTQKYVTQELSKLSTPYTVVIVNNDSTEEKSRQLANVCGLEFVMDDSSIVGILPNKGYLIWSPENLGYAKGNNKGVRFLDRIGKFTHYLFSNDDIEIEQSNILEILADRMNQDEKIGAIGPRIVGLEGRDQSPHDTYVSPYRLIGWKLLPFLRKNNKASREKTPSKPLSRFTYWVQGSFMLVDALVFKEVGMFDEHTFLYFEESILAEKLISIGKSMYFDSDVKIVHYEGGSTKRNKMKESIETDSRIYYLKCYKNVPQILLWVLKTIY